MKLLDEKIFAISGAGRGLGRAMAIALAAEGAAIIVNDIGTSPTGEGADATPAAEVVREIEAAGGRAVAVYESVADWKGAGAIVQAAMDIFGRIDGVINNAGVVRDAIFHKMTEEDWDAVINVHLKGAFNLSRHAAPYFKAQASGCFIHMTSTTGLVGAVGQANYGAAKLGMVGLSKCISLDMQRFNVRSNCIAPGAATRMTDSIPADQVERRAKIALMSPEKVAALAVALAASDVSGQVFFARRNEIMLMSQSRAVRCMQSSEGWTPHRIRDEVFPALKPDFYPLAAAGEVFSWDPA